MITNYNDSKQNEYLDEDRVHPLNKLNSNNIYEGDCLEFMKMLPDKYIDMILCDLPYGITQNKWDKKISLEKLWKQYKRIIRDNGVIVLTAKQPFTSDLVMSNLNWFKYEWIWIKNRGTGHLNAEVMPLSCHENILVFCEGKMSYYPQKNRAEPYQRLKCSRDKTNKGCYGRMNKTTDTINLGDRYPLSYLFFNKIEHTLHPTEKPIKLFRFLIKTYTKEGDLVFDNCMGSGTTAVACKQLNRKWLGCEINPDYIKIINKRLQQTQLNDDGGTNFIEFNVSVKRSSPPLLFLIHREANLEMSQHLS